MVLDKLEGVKSAGTNHWMARCPGHPDDTPSLSVTDAGDRTLLHCHAGCCVDDVVNAIGWSRADLFVASAKAETVPIAEYEYRGLDGVVSYVVERLVGKGFRQRHFDGGEWKWNMDGVARIPYQLKQLVDGIDAGRWVLIVEGEKDVHRLTSSGFVATTTSGGSAAWRNEYATWFAGARVAILPDNDEPGRKYGHNVAASLQDIAADVRVINLPGLGAGEDVSDFLDKLGTPDDIKSLIKEAPSYLPTPTLTLSQVKPHDVKWIWEDRVPARKFTIMAGEQGRGKSHLSLALAASLSVGYGFPGIDRPASSLFITYEDDPNDTIRPRAEALGADLDRIHVWDARTEPFDVTKDIPRIQALLRARPDIELIVLDPLVSALALEDAYRETEVRNRLGRLLSLDRTVLGLMHLNKGGDFASMVYRVTGSVAFTALARSVILVEEDRCRVIKSNLAGRSAPVKFGMEDGTLRVHHH